MTDEEKKAIENLKTDIRYSDLLTTYNDDIDTILNLIEKQEKVIDEIKYKLEEQIQFCNREKSSSENNHICYLSVGFYEKLLDIINREKKDEPR